MNPTTTTVYLHGGGDSTDEYSDLWPPEAEQQRTFHYCGYEVAMEVEVDLDTGKWRPLAFDGYAVECPHWFPGKTEKP